MKRAQELLGCKSTHRPYQKGQKVWLGGTNLHTTHPTVKLHPKHYGLFKVIEVLGPTTYRLELPAQWKIHNAFHGSLLLPYYETKEHGRNFPEPAPDLIEGQPEWEVEDILDSRQYRCKLQYLIRWKGYSDAHNSWEPKEAINAPVLLAAFYGRNPGAIRKTELEKADCGQRTLSSDLGECTRVRKTQPWTSKRPPMHIRSARIVNEEINMSGGCTPANPSPSSSQSTQCDHRVPLTLSQAIDNLIQSARQQQDQLRQEVSIDSLWRAILCPMSTPLPAISVIVAEGSLVEPQSTFADTVESLSQSMTQTGSSLASNTISLGRSIAAENTNQPWIPSASSVASASTRRTNMRQLSGHILSTLLRRSGNDTAEPAFPAETLRPTTSGTTQDTTTTLPFTTAAHMSTSSSSGEHRTLGSTHTGQKLAAEEGKHRSSIQTTVDNLGELVECFRALNFEGRDEFFQCIVTTIPPITRTRSNAVGRRGPAAGTSSTQTGKEAQQNTRRNQDAVVDAATAERPVWQPILRRYEPYAVLATLARREAEDGRARMPAPLGGPPLDAETAGASTLTVPSFTQHVETRETQGELPSTGSEEAMLPPGLMIIPSSPPPHVSPIDISPDSSSHQCSSSSSHPSARLTPAAETPGGIEFLERTLEMLQAEVAAINNPSPTVTSTPLPASTTSEPINNHYRALRMDGWYKYKPEQHVSHIKLRWEDPDNPRYAAYLKLEVQAGNPMLLGAMGPGEPMYGRNLNALPFHAAEPRGFTPYMFDVLANPLDPCIDRAVATLGDLGITSDIFQL